MNWNLLTIGFVLFLDVSNAFATIDYSLLYILYNIVVCMLGICVRFVFQLLSNTLA